MRRVVLLLLAPAILLAPSSAFAAQRFAAPTGSGTECTQATPCSIEEAVGKAESNDEVIVTPGTYNLAAAVKTPVGKTGIDIHGQAEQPAPKVVAAMGSFAAIEIGVGDRLTQVEVENTGTLASAIACGEKSVVDRVRATASGEGSKAIQQLASCAVRDSLLSANGKFATGLLSSGGQDTTIARNLTVIVRGAESIGASSEGFGFIPGGSTSHLLDLRNSIVRAEGTDLVSTFYFFPGPPFTIESAGDIVVANSNFATTKSAPGSVITQGSGNQTASPIFVDAELGDYTEVATSPTVDAGADDQLGPLDLAGRTRFQGPAPDIGAYEFPAATVVCGCLPRGGVRSISIKPKRFRPAKGAVVTYTMSGPATVTFSVSKKIKHKKAYRPLKGSFTREGKTGDNRFTFHGRIGGRTLKPGKYKLTALAGHLVSAAFEIGRPRKHHRHRR